MQNKRLFTAEMDFAAVDKPPIFLGTVKQLDGVTLKITPLAGYDPMTMIGVTPKLYAKKPNGEFVYQDVDIDIDLSTSQMTIQCKNFMFSDVGTVEMEIELYDDDDYLRTSPTFEIDVVQKLNQLEMEDLKEGIHISLLEELMDYVAESKDYVERFKELLSEFGDDDTIMLENLIVVRMMLETLSSEVDRLENTIAQAQEYEFEMANQEIARVAAEEKRVEAEVSRVQAETDRVNEEAKRRTTEQARVSAENTRVSNENVREASEITRKNNETQRVEAETQRQSRYNSFISDAEANANNFENYTNTAKVKEEERKSNELDRKSQEDRRVSNEVERISNEETRKTNEVVREENEISRQDIFENKVDEVDEKIVELNTTKDNFVSSINTKVDNKISEIEVAKSDMTNTVSNKVNEVETRFNALTSKQQQDAEVIDARDGETSLKARLDRDIEKAKQVYVNVEGSHISTDSSVGYLKDVEILGNTIQDASNLADIRSVGDKVEGQELYEIPVVSRGKNLLKIPDNSGTSRGITFTSKDGLVTVNGTNTGYIGYDLVNGVVSDKLVSYSLVQSILDYYSGVPKFINKPGNYTIKVDSNIPLGELTFSVNVLYDDNKHLVRANNGAGITNPFSISVDSHINGIYVGCWYSGITFDNIKLKVQIEEGTVATPYEPYQEDKLTILSPVQLEKVGDVADRIICKDGVWGVEKNIKTVRLGSESAWSMRTNKSGITLFATSNYLGNGISNRVILCDALTVNNGVNQDVIDGYNQILAHKNSSYSEYIYISKDFKNTQLFTAWLDENPINIKYVTETEPVFMPLPHDQQVKLRTFANKTNISFGCEIEGTIKAQVPKSLGATVNTHTEQINNLNKGLDRVKKLEESTVSTVTTESDFTTVEATSNGYFEDVKLEGKTLVNISPQRDIQFEKADDVNKYAFKEFLLPLAKPNTRYTIIVNVTSNPSENGTTLFSFINDGSMGTRKDYKVSTTGIQIFTMDTDNAEFPKGVKFRFASNRGGEIGTYACKDLIILDGDHTQNPPSYFEGLKSVGQDVEEMSVESINENLFDLSTIEPKMSNASGQGGSRPDSYRLLKNGVTVTCSSSYKGVMFRVKLKKYTTYTISFNKENISRLLIKPITPDNIYQYNDTISSTSANTHTFTTINSNDYWFMFDNSETLGTWSVTDIMLVEGTTPKPYTPHQSDKKRLLYYNEETQTWEKPILRQWDSIEKHADGKYYYHQRSGEVVLNGSEKWSDFSTINGVGKAYTFDIKNKAYGFDNLVCDKLPVTSIFASDATILNGISGTNSNSAIWVSINASITNVQGFKQWLQANNVTVVYQLAQEKVYECTNIDLITYGGETNYIVESGAIVPRTTLKVHNNISNVVSLLQKKVSLLESNIKASQEVQDMMILESDMRILDMELALMEHMPITLNLGVGMMLRSATCFNFLKKHIENETYEKEYLENVMNKYLATNRLTQEEYDKLYKLLYPPVYNIELPIEY